MYIDDIKKASQANLPWFALCGKNILVTGATGLIGSAIVDILMNRENLDFKVYALGRNIKRAKTLFSKYLESENFEFIQHDISEPITLNIDFHYVIHAASGANPIVYSTDPVGVMKANFYGVDNLLQYGLTHNLEKFVFVSSGDVYGEGDGRVFTEEYSGYVDILSVRSCYTSSKRAAETLCISYMNQHNVKVSIARPCHTYGPKFTETDSRAYAQFILNVLDGKDIVLKSTGEQFRSWCYVVDCALGILYVLLKGANGEAYNIADTDSNVSIKQLAEMIAEAGNKKVVFDMPSDMEKRGFNPVSKSCFDTTKLCDLGWKPSLSIKENIVNTIKERMQNENKSTS